MDEVFREYLIKIMEIDSIALDTEQVKTMEKLRLRLNEISNSILYNDTLIDPSDSSALQVKIIFFLK